MTLSIKNILTNVAVLFASVVAACLFLEFVVCKYVLIPAEYPLLNPSGPVLKFKANQKGTYRVKDEIKADFFINANGWNSGHETYLQKKEKKRIAVVGDSYISAFMVDYNNTIAEQLETETNDEYEAYRFGIDGAPLSHYLYMLRHEALQYKPDVVVFNLIHNDFDESYRRVQGVYTNAFMKLDLSNGVVNGEIEPKKFSTRWYSFIRQSNVWRYVAVRHQVRFQGLRNLILGNTHEKKKNIQYQANIDISTLKETVSDNEIATHYILEKARDLCISNNARLIVVMDGVRQQIYKSPQGPFNYSAGALRLNSMVAKVTRELDIPFIDLHPIFAECYAQYGEHFEFIHDKHWNAKGHAVAARAVARMLDIQ